MFLFGGLVGDQLTNDLYLFSVTALSATLLNTVGEVPSPRVGHVSAVTGSSLIVWGGDTNDNVRSTTGQKENSLYVLNLSRSSSIILTYPFANPFQSPVNGLR